MGAPEKIYLVNDDLNIKREWYKTKQVGFETTEYTRTDAFIEKACSLLGRMIWEVTYEDLEGDSTQHYDKMEFIEDFKNYMKGE